MTLSRTVFFLLSLFPLTAYATTWNEPWHEEVVRKSDSLLRAKVISVSDDGAVVKVVKHLAGQRAAGKIKISSSYHMLELCSKSGDGVPSALEEDSEYYLLLKSPAAGSKAWMLPTPTAGDAEVRDGTVSATFRHSCHKAVVEEELYEQAMTAIFQYLHKQPYDQQFVQRFMSEQLKQPPAGIPDDRESAESQREFATFCRQHVALELFYFFGTDAMVSQLEPHLSSKQRHVQMSAVRALSRCGSTASKKRLFDFLSGPGDGAAKVLALRGLRRLDAREYVQKLQDFSSVASDEEVHFGVRIMDPRVATAFPSSLREAVKDLLKEWNRPRK